MKLALALVLALAATARADEFDPRVIVMPVEGSAPSGLGKLGRDVGDALAKGARDSDAEVARADASLADTAVIVGCDPARRDCVDAVAAALNVDQMLIATLSAYGDDASVDITAVTRETEPLTQTFVVRKASRKADLKAIREAVRGMLEEGEARRSAQAATPDPDEPDAPDPDEPARTVDPAVGPTPPTEVDTTPSPLPRFVMIGGGAIAAVGLTFWALASSTQGDIDDAPTNTAAQLDALVALEHRAAVRANVGNALVVTGAVAIAAGAVWWLHDRQERRVAVTVTAVPGGAGLAIGGAW